MHYAAINNLVPGPGDESPDDVGILVEPEFNTFAQQPPEMFANQILARVIERFLADLEQQEPAATRSEG